MKKYDGRQSDYGCLVLVLSVVVINTLLLIGIVKLISWVVSLV